MKHTILITGSLGLLGSACAEYFHNKGWRVVGIDNNQRASLFGTEPQEDSRFVTVPCDLRDQRAVENVLKTRTFDAIIHAAAQPSHDYATDHALEDFDINARATLILLEAVRKHQPQTTFVYISTDKIYGEAMHIRLAEEKNRFVPAARQSKKRFHSLRGFTELLGTYDHKGVRSLFGCSKLAADLYVQEYAARFNLMTACFRPGCITGRKHQGAEQHGFLAYLAKCIREGKEYTIFGFKGKQVRDQIHALDVASAIWHYVRLPRKGEVYNIGGGFERSVSILEAGQLLSERIGKPFIHSFGPERVGDRPYDVHNMRRFRGHYPHWKCRFSLEDIINELAAS